MDRIVFWSPTVYESVPYPSGVEFRLLDNVQPELTQNSIYLPTGAIDDVEAAWQFSWDRLSNSDLEALRRVKDLVSVNDPLGLEIVGYIESIAPTGLSGLTDDTQDTWYRVDVVFNVVHMQWPAFLTYVRNDGRVLTADSTHGVGEGVYPPIVVRGQDVEVTDTKWLRFYGGEAMPWANHQLASSDIQKRGARTLPAPSGVEPRWLRLSGQQVHPQVGSIYTGMRSLFSDGSRISFLRVLAEYRNDTNFALADPNNTERPAALKLFGGDYNTTKIQLDYRQGFDWTSPWTVEVWCKWTDTNYMYGKTIMTWKDRSGTNPNCDLIVYISSGMETLTMTFMKDGAVTNAVTTTSVQAVTGSTFMDDWKHVRLVHDGTSLRLSVTDRTTATHTEVAAYTVPSDLLSLFDTLEFGDAHTRLGQTNYSNHTGWGGLMDDIRIWQTADTSVMPDPRVPITDHQNHPALVRHLKLDAYMPTLKNTWQDLEDSSISATPLGFWDSGSAGGHVRSTHIDTAVKRAHYLSADWGDAKNGLPAVRSDNTIDTEVVFDPDEYRSILLKPDNTLTSTLPLGAFDSAYMYVVFQTTWTSKGTPYLQLWEDGRAEASLSMVSGRQIVKWFGGEGVSTGRYIKPPHNKRYLASIYAESGGNRFIGKNNAKDGYYYTTSNLYARDPATSRELRLLPGTGGAVAIYAYGLVTGCTEADWQAHMDTLMSEYGIS